MTSVPAALVALRDSLKTWLTEHAFAVWWRPGADLERGGFHDWLDGEGRPLSGAKRCRVQARQVFCYAAAPGLGWEGPWRAAMDHGAAALEGRFRRPDGLYRARLAEGDDAVDLYDQAFVLLAQASLASRGDDEAPARARALLARLPAEAAGGFAELDGGPLNANPNMHLFEAFLALAGQDGDGPWRAAAAGQARLAMTRLIAPASGAVSELFGPGWSAPAKQSVWPGHQFEWAWLLMRFSMLAGDAAALAAALRLVELGERAGVDPDRNVAINALDGDLELTDPGTRLWPQTERLRAHALAGAVTGDGACWDLALKAGEGLALFLTPEGRWIDSLESGDRSAPASSFYHLVGAVVQLDRVVDGRT